MIPVLPIPIEEGDDMPLTVRQRAAQAFQQGVTVTVKRGDEIFEGTDYPRTWDGFVGQQEAILQLRTSVASARSRGVRLDHTLLASGQHGIGKTTLAMILASEMGAGLVTISGAMTGEDFARAVRSCRDGDIVFWDEFHLAVAGNRNRADWLLPFLTDGVLMTKVGAVPLPAVTLVAATTDAGKLPQTILSRFMVRPRLAPYSASEAEVICLQLARRMKVRLGNAETTARRIAVASGGNPRAMRLILTAVRDMALANDGQVSLKQAFLWAGVTEDGLTREAMEIMFVLIACRDYTASLETIQAALAEPGPLRHAEQLLIQQGYLVISGRGRTLTAEGVSRVQKELL